MDDKELKRGRGRPVGSVSSRFTRARSLRLLAEDEADLVALSAEWRTSEAETLRRALREAADDLRRQAQGRR